MARANSFVRRRFAEAEEWQFASAGGTGLHMIHRILFYVLILVAAGALPYVSSEWRKASRPLGADATELAETAPPTAATAAGPAGASPSILLATPTSVPKIGEPPLVAIEEAIRFDVTTPWLFSRWPRVTTGLPDGQLQGYRVPLVTGTREDDLAGSLTYYFDVHQVCKRITFQGTVGDPRRITSHVISRFGLPQQKGDDPGLQIFQSRWNGKPVSELRIKAAPVVKSNAPHARYDVQLTLNSWARK
jgi:hypothetical protein